MAHMYAELASRTEVNFNDIQLALQELRVSVRDLITFATQADEIPFGRAIPRFPVRRKAPKANEELRQEPEQPLPEHVPAFLPPFPDSHTFKDTPVWWWVCVWS